MKCREAAVVSVIDISAPEEEVFQNKKVVSRPGCCLKWCAPGWTGKVDGEYAEEELDKWEIAPSCGPVEGRHAVLRGNSVVVHSGCETGREGTAGD